MYEFIRGMLKTNLCMSQGFEYPEGSFCGAFCDVLFPALGAVIWVNAIFSVRKTCTNNSRT